MTQNALIYCRISQDREGGGLGVDRQEADCRKKAAELGLTVVDVFADNDTSAFSGKVRRGYRDMLAALERGEASVVIAWHTDRLLRLTRELESYIDFSTAHGITTYTVQAGKLDLSTPDGRMNAKIVGAIAQRESEHKGERVRARYRQRVMDEHGFGGGARRYGFARDGITIIPAEAAEIAKATSAILAGASIRSVVMDLNERGKVTSSGKPWSPRAVREVLTRPKNAGILVYGGQEAGTASHPAIVPEEHFREVVRLLGDPARRTSASNKVSALGSGLYVCGKCEAAETKCRIGYSGTGARVRAYRCPAASHLTRAAGPLDDFIESVIIGRLSQPDAAGLFTTSTEDMTQVYSERQVLGGKLDELAAMYAAGDITGPQLKTGTARLRAQTELLDARISRASAHSPLAAFAGQPDVAKVWSGLDLSRRRAVLDTLATVTLLPAAVKGSNRFDPDAVALTWKVALGHRISLNG